MLTKPLTSSEDDCRIDLDRNSVCIPNEMVGWWMIDVEDVRELRRGKDHILDVKFGTNQFYWWQSYYDYVESQYLQTALGISKLTNSDQLVGKTLWIWLTTPHYAVLYSPLDRDGNPKDWETYRLDTKKTRTEVQDYPPDVMAESYRIMAKFSKLKREWKQKKRTKYSWRKEGGKWVTIPILSK